MSDFTISPASLSDVSDIVMISRAVLSPHLPSYWMFPPDNEAAMHEWRLSSIKNVFENESYCTYSKIVDNAVGKIVAFALWEAPHPPETKEERLWKEQEKKEKADTDNALPEGTNVQLLQDWVAETQKTRAKYVDIEKDYILRAVATLPEYQGRGCASMLLRSGLEKIDAEGAKAWLETTPQGQSLYVKFGWKVIDEIVFDLEKYGCGQYLQRTPFMERAAQI